MSRRAEADSLDVVVAMRIEHCSVDALNMDCVASQRSDIASSRRRKLVASSSSRSIDFLHLRGPIGLVRCVEDSSKSDDRLVGDGFGDRRRTRRTAQCKTLQIFDRRPELSAGASSWVSGPSTPLEAGRAIDSRRSIGLCSRTRSRSFVIASGSATAGPHLPSHRRNHAFWLARWSCSTKTGSPRASRLDRQ